MEAKTRYKAWMKKLLLCLAFVLGTVPLAFSEEGGYSLEIEIDGAKAGVGQALFGLFDSKANFLKEPIISEKSPIDADGKVRFRIEGLRKGEYAFSIVYDEDKNGKLNTGLFGIPTEKVAVSNNPKARFGPPSFADSVFMLAENRKVEMTFGSAKN